MSNQPDLAGAAAEPVCTVDNPPSEDHTTPDQRAEAIWLRLRAAGLSSILAHQRPRFLERAPIRLYGRASSAASQTCFLYRDAQGQRRVLVARQHDRKGIASLFVGEEDWLRRLWPTADGGWDHDKAAETLMHFNACIGIVDAAKLGFELPPARRRR